MTLHGKSAETVLDAAWQAYAYAADAIAALESVGIAIDGCVPERGNLSALYGVQTRCSDIIREAYGIPAGTRYQSGVDELLSELAGMYGPEPVMPANLKRKLAAIAAMADKDAGILGDPDLLLRKPFEVTVSMAGSIRVHAATEDEAESIVSAMGTDGIVARAAWCDPETTDAQEA